MAGTHGPRGGWAPFPRGRTGNGFTLLEVVLSLVLVGVLGLVLARSASSYVDLFRVAHTVSDLSQKEWAAASRVVREVRYAEPNSLQVDGDGLGFSMNLQGHNGIVEGADHQGLWISTSAPGLESVPAGARLLARRKQANTLFETRVVRVEPPQPPGNSWRIYYQKAPGFASIGPGDEFWIVGETIAFRKTGDQVVRRTRPDGSAPWNESPLVDTVSRFTVSRQGADAPLCFELFLSENGVEVGGPYQARPQND